MVMAQSLFKKLKQNFPQSEIDVVAPGWSVPLLKRMPEVHGGVELPVGHKQLGLMSRYRVGKSLRDRNYDLAIVTPRSFKSALVPFFARARQRTGYLGETRYGLLNDIRPLDKSILTQTVQRYVALGESQGASLPPVIEYPELDIDADNQARLINELGLATQKAVVGFMPGAEFGPAKQWPEEYFNELAGLLAKDEINVWVFGSHKETGLGEAIARNNPNVSNLCGRTSLTDAVDLIAYCKTTVTNDSGLMHVACATGRQVIAIYGSSDPGYTPPLSDSAIILRKDLECSPCFDRHCRFGHYNCLRQITPADIHAQLVGSQ